MTYNKHRRLAGTVRYLPEVFNVQPTSDYESLMIATNARDLMLSAWERTNENFATAFELVIAGDPVLSAHRAEIQKLSTCKHTDDSVDELSCY